MSDIEDHEIERISNLFAAGNMTHAKEIVRLLAKDVAERPLRPHPLQAALERFLNMIKIANGIAIIR